MKIFLAFVLGLVTAAKSQSVDEVLSGCEIRTISFYGGVELECNDFQHPHLPYSEEFKNATYIDIKGNFTSLTIDPKYFNLYSLDISSKNFQNFQLYDYSMFTKIFTINVRGSEQLLTLNLTGVEKLPSLRSIHFWGNKLIRYLCENPTSSYLSSDYDWLALSFTSSNFEKFDYNCFPSKVRSLDFSNNSFATPQDQINLFDYIKHRSNLTFLAIGALSLESNQFNFGDFPRDLQYFSFQNSEVSEIQGCEELRSLSNLRRLELSGNKLTSFDVSCLPRNLEFLNLDVNMLSDINLSAMTPSRPIELGISANPIQCTCSFMRGYIQLLDSGNVTFRKWSNKNQTVNCANTDSKLAVYPWSNDASALKLFDVSALNCLEGGEDDAEEN